VSDSAKILRILDEVCDATQNVEKQRTPNPSRNKDKPLYLQRNQIFNKLIAPSVQIKTSPQLLDWLRSHESKQIGIVYIGEIL
jgi:hypothetical protein